MVKELLLKARDRAVVGHQTLATMPAPWLRRMGRTQNGVPPTYFPTPHIHPPTQSTHTVHTVHTHSAHTQTHLDTAAADRIHTHPPAQQTTTFRRMYLPSPRPTQVSSNFRTIAQALREFRLRFCRANSTGSNCWKQFPTRAG